MTGPTGDHNTIFGIGSNNLVDGSGGPAGPAQVITFIGDNQSEIGPGGHSSLIGVIGDGNLLHSETGNDTTWGIGSGDFVSDTGGSNLVGVIGSNTTISESTGNDTVWSIGDSQLIHLGDGNNLAGLIGSNSLLIGGAGSDTVWVIGSSDTVAGGAGNDVVGLQGSNNVFTNGPGADDNALVYFGGSNATLLDNAMTVYNDTVVGFEQSAGDRIKLTSDTEANAIAHSTQVNGGQDTLISLSDGSTILLKGVGHIDSSFFS